jgi:hypothetical protein
MKLGSYSISTRPVLGICKQAALWGHDAERNGMTPLAYLQRPKWISDEGWNLVLGASDWICPSELT